MTAETGTTSQQRDVAGSYTWGVSQALHAKVRHVSLVINGLQNLQALHHVSERRAQWSPLPIPHLDVLPLDLSECLRNSVNRHGARMADILSESVVG